MATPAMIELVEVMPTKSGSVDPSKFSEEAFDLYSIPAFDRGEPDVELGSNIGSAKQIVEPGDVLLSKIVPHIRRAWVVGLARGRRLIASGEWIVFRSARLHPPYLRHVLIGDPFHANFMQTVSGVGGSLLRARPSHVANIRVPLPPLPEQRRIAEILDKADALRAKRRAALALLDTLTQSIFLDMFGDPARNPRGWARVPFCHLLESIDSGWSPTCLARPASSGEWGVLKLGAVTWCEFDPTENKALLPHVEPIPELEVKSGDLLFARKNTYDLVAACALVRETPPRLLMSDLIFRFRLRSDAAVNTTFLHQLLIYPTKRREVQRLAGGSAGSMPNISKGRLEVTPIEVPPLDLQREFANRITKVEQVKAAYRVSLAEIGALFECLQHRAFSGEL